MELKTMVDAISAASQREAEAHNKAIIRSKENDELHLKLEVFNEANNELKAIIKEKNSLIEMYERAASEFHFKGLNDAESAGPNDMEVEDNGVLLDFTKQEDNEIGTVINKLEEQLSEMHEEIDKLMGLYEKARLERDEFKRLLYFGGQKGGESGELDYPEKLIEVDKGKNTVETEKHKDNAAEKVDEKVNFYDTVIGSLNLIPVNVLGDLNLAKLKLEKAEQKVSDSTRTLALLGSLECSFMEFYVLWREFESKKERVQVKQQELRVLEHLSSEMRDRKVLTEKRLSELKYSISCYLQSLSYFELLEARAMVRLNAASVYVDQKNEELTHLQVCKGKTEAAMGRAHKAELELRNKCAILKSKLEEEKLRQENEKVLFAIDNIEKYDAADRNWHRCSNAMDLLKSEEEKTKIQTEIQRNREKLDQIILEMNDYSNKSLKIENEIELVQNEIWKGSRYLEEIKIAFKHVSQEKKTLLEMEENGTSDVGSMIIEYQQYVFEEELKEMETKTMEEEIEVECLKLEELRRVRAAAYQKMAKVLEERNGKVSEKMEEDLRNVWICIMEVKTLLEEN